MRDAIAEVDAIVSDACAADSGASSVRGGKGCIDLDAMDAEQENEFDLLEKLWAKILFFFHFHLADERVWSNSSAFKRAYSAFKGLFAEYNMIAGRINGQLGERRSPQRLQLLVVPELSALEVIGLRLYTGPMFNRYNNGVCRQRKHGVYATTIWVINSGLVKLARVTKATTVWRGVKGKLPDQFFTKNAFNVSGGIELAFMSTTTDQRVASGYMRGQTGVLFEIEMGMIDKGADVSILSQ